MRHWKNTDSKINEFKQLVENGEFYCVPCGKKDKQTKATQVKTVYRRFAMFIEVVDVPVCDDHTDYHY